MGQSPARAGAAQASRPAPSADSNKVLRQAGILGSFPAVSRREVDRGRRYGAAQPVGVHLEAGLTSAPNASTSRGRMDGSSNSDER